MFPYRYTCTSLQIRTRDSNSKIRTMAFKAARTLLHNIAKPPSVLSIQSHVVYGKFVSLAVVLVLVHIPIDAPPVWAPVFTTLHLHWVWSSSPTPTSSSPKPDSNPDPEESKAGTPTPVAGNEMVPVTYVGLAEARAYCTWAGKRLPSDIEWQYAAQVLCFFVWTKCEFEACC